MSIVGLLIATVVAVILVIVAKYLADHLELKDPLRGIAFLLVFLVAILIISSQFGALGPGLVIVR